MKKKDKEKINAYIESIAKGYSYCFSYTEPSKNYMKRFSNNRYDSALYRGELTALHLDILESNDIFDTYNGIENEAIDAELRKYYTKVFIEEVTKQLEIRRVEEEKEKAKQKALEEEAKGKTSSKKSKKK